MPQVGEHVVLSWDAVTEYTGPDGTVYPVRGDVDYYEVRRGSNWTFGKRVFCTPCTAIRTRDWVVGTETYYVAPRFKNGRYGAPASVSVTCTTPGDHSDANSQDETTASGGWPGIHSGTEADGTSLVLSSGETTGTYTSPEIDLGSLDTWRIGTKLHVSCTNTALTWQGLPWSGTSALTWEEMADAYGSENYWSWSGAMIQELDWSGNNVYAPTASYTLEYTVYSTSGNPGSFEAASPGEYCGRYLKFRVTLNRTDTTNETISVTDCVTTWSIPSAAGSGSGRPNYDVTRYGATGDGVTDDTAAINAAITAATATRGVVFFPTGTYVVTSTITVPSFVWLEGPHNGTTKIQAGAAFPVSTPVIALGSTSSVTNARLHRISVDCNDIEDSTGVYSAWAQEFSGCTEFQVVGYRKYGIHFETDGAQQFLLENLGISASHTESLSAGAAAIYVDTGGQGIIRYVSCGGGVGNPCTYAVYIDGNVNVQQIHVEQATYGIYLDTGASGTVSGLYGHSTITTLLYMASGYTRAENVLANSSTNILVDAVNSKTFTSATLSYITSYYPWYEMHGPVVMKPGTQTGRADLTIPDLGGSNRSMMVSGVSAFSDLTGTVSLAQGGAAASLAAVDPLDLIRMNIGGTALESAGVAVSELALASSLANYLPLAGGTMSGAIAMGTNEITAISTAYANKFSLKSGSGSYDSYFEATDRLYIINSRAGVNGEVYVYSQNDDVRLATSGGYLLVDAAGDVTLTGDINVDAINEATGDTGVTVDGVLIQDGEVDGVDVSAIPTSYLPIGGGTLTGDLQVNTQILVDDIIERTPGHGVEIDSVTMWDGGVYFKDVGNATQVYLYADTTMNYILRLPEAESEGSDETIVTWSNDTSEIQLDGAEMVGDILVTGDLDVDGLLTATDNLVCDSATHRTYLGLNCGGTPGSGSEGNNTVFVGEYAGYRNNQNDTTAVGKNACYMNTGVGSAGVGYYAGYYNTGAYSTFLGYFAGRSNTGSSQSAFGFYAGMYNTGDYQTVFGRHAGQYNQGDHQLGYGYAAGFNNTGGYLTVFGDNSGRYNDGDNNTVVGPEAFNAFPLDSGSAVSFDYTDVDQPNNRVTVTAHGLGSNGTYRNLRFDQGTAELPGIDNTGIDIWYIVDANTLQCITDTITATGSGTGHTLTPQYVYSNSTAIGYNAEPDASNQVVLGDANVTELKTAALLNITRVGTNNLDGSLDVGVDLDVTGDISGDDVTVNGQLDASAEPMLIYQYSGERTGTTDGEFWVENQSGTRYLRVRDGGSDFKVQLTAV